MQSLLLESRFALSPAAWLHITSGRLVSIDETDVLVRIIQLADVSIHHRPLSRFHIPWLEHNSRHQHTHN